MYERNIVPARTFGFMVTSMTSLGNTWQPFLRDDDDDDNPCSRHFIQSAMSDEVVHSAMDDGIAATPLNMKGSIGRGRPDDKS